MQNNNIQPPSNFPKKPFLVFLVAFASIGFIWFKLHWRYLLFIVTYSYVGIARNWSHKRQTSQGQKFRPKAENNGGLLREKPVSGAQPRKQTFFRYETPLRCIH